MIELQMKSTWTAVMALLLATAGTFAADTPEFKVGERETVATKSQRDALGLKWFHDGNLGMVQAGTEVWLYGASDPPGMFLPALSQEWAKPYTPTKFATARTSSAELTELDSSILFLEKAILMKAESMGFTVIIQKERSVLK